MDRLSLYSAAMQQAIQADLLAEEDTTIIWIDEDVLQAKVSQLQTSFPPSTLHAVAIKSNPLVKVLEQLVTWGVGLEAASMGEMALAKAAGCPNDRLVFDSPAKTQQEIREVITTYKGCYLNADNLEELDRIPHDAAVKVGLRINMGKNVTGVQYLNVSERYSKFGAPIHEREQIVAAVRAHPRVTGLHIHSGSQMDQLEQSVANISSLIQLANAINEAQPGKIRWIDIGGGLPVDYHNPSQDALAEYVALLEVHCPQLFDGSYQVITELGRWVHAQAGWTATRVEYVKPTDEGGVAVIHAGADLFLRECYTPGTWYHGLQVLDTAGAQKSRRHQREYTLAGPLCFGGDIVDRERLLPEISAGDWIIIEDTGANSFALWSRHCSRAFPKVLACKAMGNRMEMNILRRRESFKDIIHFWGG